MGSVRALSSLGASVHTPPPGSLVAQGRDSKVVDHFVSGRLVLEKPCSVRISHTKDEQ
jgi:hypothetical protein